MRIHCFQHVTFENPGTILEWVKENNHFITYTPIYEASHQLPSLDDLDLLLIMGGYMNAEKEDEFPWLREEKQFIRQAIEANKKILGICLGAQLISSALGSRVYTANEKEIGFFPVSFVKYQGHTSFDHFKSPYMVFHWHGDTFDLPVGAKLLASSGICKNQAFTIGENVIALQFHLEMNIEILENMLLHEGKELKENGPYIQSKKQIQNAFSILQQNKLDMFRLIDKFVE